MVGKLWREEIWELSALLIHFYCKSKLKRKNSNNNITLIHVPMEMDGGSDCTMEMYSIPQYYLFKIVKMINFVLYIPQYIEVYHFYFSFFFSIHKI